MKSNNRRLYFHDIGYLPTVNNQTILKYYVVCVECIVMIVRGNIINL